MIPQVFPAYAGMSQLGSHARDQTQGFPRLRGDEPS